MLFDINNLLDHDYSTIIYMNHYSIFLMCDIKKLLLELVSNHTNIVLPNLINMPIELVPMVIRNCSWSKRFFQLYNQSRTNNIKKFIEIYSFNQSEHIKYTNYINNSSKPFNMKQDIIKQFIQNNYKDTTENMSYINTKLGIL
jgi:hypothetical protein